MENVEQRYMSAKEVAHFLGVSRWTIHRLVKDQAIPFVPIRGAIRFDREDLLVWTKKVKVPIRRN